MSFKGLPPIYLNSCLNIYLRINRQRNIGTQENLEKKEDAKETIRNLFNFAEIENKYGNDIRRIDAVRTERLSADSRRHEQGLSGRTEINSESEPQESGRTYGRGAESSTEQHRAVRPRLLMR